MSLRTKSDVREWIEGAFARFGDASAVTGLVFAQYVKMIDPQSPLITFTAEGRKIQLHLNKHPVRISLSQNRRPRFSRNCLVEFGVDRIGADLWDLHPSLNLPGYLHVFVVFYSVPESVDW